MDRTVPQLPQNLRQLSRTRPGKNFYIFLFCVFIAVVFWCLKTFSKDYSTIVDFPVRYTNLPARQVVLNELPQTIQVEVESHGFGLLSQSLRTSPDTVAIRADQLQERDSKNGRYAYLLTKSLLSSVSDQLRNDITVSRILTDTIYFYFDREVTRTIPVEPNFTRLDFAPQYLLDGAVNLLPTAIRVTGPASVLDTLDKLKTEPLEFAELSETATQSVRFMASKLPGISCVPNEVLITVPVDKFTETTIQVPVVAQNVPDSLELRLFPTFVDVTLQVAYHHYDKIQPSMFTATVDANDLLQNPPTRLRVTVAAGPDYAKIIRQDPLRVEYIQKRKPSS